MGGSATTLEGMRTAALLLALAACSSPICAGCGGDDGGPTDGLPSSFALTAVAGTASADGYCADYINDSFTMNVRKWSTAECTCYTDNTGRSPCHLDGETIACRYSGPVPFDWTIAPDAATDTADVTLVQVADPPRGCSGTVQTTLVQIPDV